MTIILGDLYYFNSIIEKENDPIDIYEEDFNEESSNEEVVEENKDSNELASYTTKILTSDNNRYNNIKIVSEKLNGYVLYPNENFSFNEVCGPYGSGEGFLEATILLSDGKESKGFGGGVCQLSSTLYNAIKNLKVEITERHQHSSPVAYVPLNEDATVSLQSGLDFRFTNKYDYPIKFECKSTPDKLSVSVKRET